MGSCLMFAYAVIYMRYTHLPCHTSIRGTHMPDNFEPHAGGRYAAQDFPDSCYT